jgi:EmrB/QacA subfamily drug resistance transporter
MSETTVAVTPPAATAPDAADPRRWIALAVVLTAAFMVLLDISIVNVAIPSIQQNLHASFGEVQFVLAGYQLAYAVTLITGGRLGDILGRKRMFMVGMAGFSIASALCGAAQSPVMLITSRVVQGLCAALMYPQVLSVIQVSFLPRERGSAFGLFGATIGIATITGPLAGGLLIGNDITGGRWRLIFLVNVPIGIASLIAAALLLRESRAPQAPRLDLAGVLIVSTGLFLLTYPLVEGRDAGWPWWAFAMLVCAVPVLLLFAIFERRRGRRNESPLVEPALFKDRAFVVGAFISMVFFSGIPAFFFILGLTLQVGLQFSPLHAGLTTVPFAVSSGIASAMSARLAPRMGKSILNLGALLIVVGIISVIITLHETGVGVAPYQLTPALLVSGLGLGLIIAPLINVILATINTAIAGSASGVLTTTQQIGGAVGVAVVGVVFFGLLGSRADTVSAGVTPTLRQQLVAQGIPTAGADAAVRGFTTCFHDRATAIDPTAEQPSCRAAQANSDRAPNPAAARSAFSDAATTATGRDFIGALERSLIYQIAVFGATFFLVFLLPRARRQTGPPGASGVH